MSERIEQHYFIKFCYKLGDTQVQTIRKIKQAFGDKTMGITRIKEWYNCFKHGQTSVESKPRLGRPSTSRIEEFIENVRLIVEDDRRITINENTEEVGISTGSEMWTARNWQLHHGNASAHSAQLIQAYLDKNNTPFVRNPPYSPDMAPCDSLLFP
ncbi:protein GVQW3-like [Palaemon carinicauda]|uniref:protein GVQW3-like n=1 Tax=Palaemon carinicauda TaxID=392227 RepID=UPI0035B57148